PTTNAVRAIRTRVNVADSCGLGLFGVDSVIGVNAQADSSRLLVPSSGICLVSRESRVPKRQTSDRHNCQQYAREPHGDVCDTTEYGSREEAEPEREQRCHLVSRFGVVRIRSFGSIGFAALDPTEQ